MDTCAIAAGRDVAVTCVAVEAADTACQAGHNSRNIDTVRMNCVMHAEAQTKAHKQARPWSHWTISYVGSAPNKTAAQPIGDECDKTNLETTASHGHDKAPQPNGHICTHWPALSGAATSVRGSRRRHSNTSTDHALSFSVSSSASIGLLPVTDLMSSWRSVHMWQHSVLGCSALQAHPRKSPCRGAWQAAPTISRRPADDRHAHATLQGAAVTSGAVSKPTLLWPPAPTWQMCLCEPDGSATEQGFHSCVTTMRRIGRALSSESSSSSCERVSCIILTNDSSHRGSPHESHKVTDS